MSLAADQQILHVPLSRLKAKFILLNDLYMIVSFFVLPDADVLVLVGQVLPVAGVVVERPNGVRVGAKEVLGKYIVCVFNDCYSICTVYVNTRLHQIQTVSSNLHIQSPGHTRSVPDWDNHTSTA